MYLSCVVPTIGNDKFMTVGQHRIRIFDRPGKYPKLTNEDHEMMLARIKTDVDPKIIGEKVLVLQLYNNKDKMVHSELLYLD